MMKRKTIPFNFSDKHKAYIKRSVECMYNIAEGAVRAGKTVDNIFAFAHELKTAKDKLHLATGSTVANAKLNIGDANGFGLEYIFRGQSHWGKYKDNEALFIKGPATNNKTKIVIFAGGAKADSYKKIRGNSYGMWIATEVNLHHDNTIKEAFNRTAAAHKRKFFWDLNPDNPNADIYKSYIDKYVSKAEAGELLGGCNYEHFTIDDNINISEQRRSEIKSQYDPDSIWYRRDILGERCAAEGVIYKAFAANPDKYMLKFDNDSEGHSWLSNIDFITIGIDFGGNRSLTTFVATAIGRGFKTADTIMDYHIEGEKGDIDPERLNKEFIGFYYALQKEYPGIEILYAFADNEAQYLINGLRRACFSAGLGVKIMDSAKRRIVDRVHCGSTMISIGKMRIDPCCELLKAGLRSAVWDAKAAEKGEDKRLDNFSSDIDILDAWEYGWERFMSKLMPGFTGEE